MLNPIALRKAKIVNNFDLSECNRVKALIINSKKAEFASSEDPDKAAQNEAPYLARNCLPFSL